MPTPRLETPRLILRPMAPSDASAVQRHFNNWNIIRNLATVVPWPYPDDGAETFIARELGKIAAGEDVYHWMLVLRPGDGEAIGTSISGRTPATPRATAASGWRSPTGAGA